MYRKPVYSTSVQETSLQYMCTENQFNIQVYRKPIYSTSVQKTSLKYMFTERNVQGQTLHINLHSTTVEYNTDRTCDKKCTGTDTYKG